MEGFPGLLSRACAGNDECAMGPIASLPVSHIEMVLWWPTGGTAAHHKVSSSRFVLVVSYSTVNRSYLTVNHRANQDNSKFRTKRR